MERSKSEGWDAVPLLLGVGIRQKTVPSSLLSLLSWISNTSTHRPRRAWETASLLGLAHEKSTRVGWEGASVHGIAISSPAWGQHL